MVWYHGGGVKIKIYPWRLQMRDDVNLVLRGE